MKLPLIILVLLLFDSCKQVEKRPLVPVSGYLTFANDPSLSDKHGKPVDSLMGYIPVQKLFDTAMRIDSFKMQMCSKYLSQMKEPLLHNYYFNKIIYRLTFVPGIMWGPFSVSFIKDRNSCYMTVKATDNKNEDSLVINERVPIEVTLLDSLAALIESEKFVTMPALASRNSMMLDDVGNFVEVHNKNGYLYVFRWGYQDSLFKKVAMVFFDTSNILSKQQHYIRTKYNLCHQ